MQQPAPNPEKPQGSYRLRHALRSAINAPHYPPRRSHVDPFVVPDGCTFSVGECPTVDIRVIDGIDLVSEDLNGTSDPYCIVRQSEHKKQKTTIKKETLNPTWNELIHFGVSDPVTDLMIIEVWDHDSLISDDFLGYVPIDLSLLPKGVEVVTSENLSFVAHGKIHIGITARGFGLENIPADYISRYVQWRESIPGHNAHGWHRAKTEHQLREEAQAKINSEKPLGLYANKNVPKQYCVLRGNVKRIATGAEAAVRKLDDATKGVTSFLTHVQPVYI